MINDIQQNYKYFHNHTKIFKQIFIFFHGEAHRSGCEYMMSLERVGFVVMP